MTEACSTRTTVLSMLLASFQCSLRRKRGIGNQSSPECPTQPALGAHLTQRQRYGSHRRKYIARCAAYHQAVLLPALALAQTKGESGIHPAQAIRDYSGHSCGRICIHKITKSRTNRSKHSFLSVLSRRFL